MAVGNVILPACFLQDRERAREEQLNILTSCTDSMRRSLVLTDFSLVCKGQVIPVHRLILAASSPFFHTMFTNGLTGPSSVTEVYFPNLDPITMEALLDFMYNGYINISLQNLEEIKNIISAAYQLEINIVFNYCCSALLKTLNEKHFSELWMIAQKYNHDDMKNHISHFIAEHFTETSSSSEFLLLSLEAVAAVLTCDLLNCSMDYILRAVIRWVKHSTKEREPQLPMLLCYVDFEALSKEYLESILLNESLLKDSVHLMNLVMDVCSSRALKGPAFEKRTKKGKKKKHGVGDLELYSPIVSSPYPLVDTEEWFIILKKTDLEDGGVLRIFYPETRKAASIQSFKFPLLLESAVCYDEKKVYFIGGRNKRLQVFDLVYALEIVTCIWEHVTFLDEGKFAAGCVYKNGFIYVAGGTNSAAALLNTFQRFDLTNGCWQKMPSMLVKRKSPALLSGGVNLYAISHTADSKRVSMEYYNYLCNQWTIIPLEDSIANSVEEKNFFLTWQDGLFHIVCQSLMPQTYSEMAQLKAQLKVVVHLHTKKKGEQKYRSQIFNGVLSPILSVASAHGIQGSSLLIVDVLGNILKYCPENATWKRMACPLDYPSYAIFLGRRPSFFNIV